MPEREVPLQEDVSGARAALRTALRTRGVRLARADHDPQVGEEIAPSLAVMASLVTGRSANRIEIALGRTAAACAHPLAAWHTARRSFRMMIVAGYFAMGFTAALTVLFLA